jgi:hypothetical protein
MVSDIILVLWQHCWGTVQPVKLTARSEARLRAGIPDRELPASFKQAVAICRELDVRYLWIDSLCIRQDNLGDWNVQAALMGQVYASASCNIAATSAKDGTVGLSFSRLPLVVSSGLVRLAKPLPYSVVGEREPATEYYLCSEYPDLADGALNSRAWVSQGKLPNYSCIR